MSERDGSGRRHRRRARRAGGGVHAGGARLRRRRCSRRVAWLGGKAAVLERGRLPLRHGADHPHRCPSVLRRIFAEAGRDLDDYLDLVRLDPQWRCFFADGCDARPRRRRRRDGGEPRRVRPGHRRGLPRLPRLLRSGCTASPSASSSGSRSAASRDMIDLKAGFSPTILGDVLAMRMGRSVAGHGAEVRARTRASPRCSTTSRSTSARRPDGVAGGAVRHRPHADAARASGIRAAAPRAVPEALAKLGEELGVEFRTGHAASGASLDGRRRRVTRRRDRRRRSGRRSRPSCRTPTRVRTHRELLGETPAPRRGSSSAASYEPACSGVVLYLGLNRAYDHLLHHNFVFSPRPARGVRLHLPQGRAGPGPDVLPRGHRPAPSPATAPPGGEALYVLVHTPYLRPHHDWTTDAARVPPRDPRTS